jgi:hypothetical protein
MHDDEEVKKDDDLEKDEKDAKDVHDYEFLIRKAGNGKGSRAAKV